MATDTLKSGSGNNLLLSNDDSSAKIEVKEDGSNEITGDTGIEGVVTKPSQPAFLVYKTGTQGSPANGATITWDAKRFDQGTDFDLSTEKFTAPVDGKYHFSWAIRVTGLASDCTNMSIYLVTTNATYTIQITPINEMDSGGLDLYSFVGSLTVDMEGDGDTAHLTISFSGTAPTNIHADSFFSGFLAC